MTGNKVGVNIRYLLVQCLASIAFHLSNVHQPTTTISNSINDDNELRSAPYPAENIIVFCHQMTSSLGDGDWLVKNGL